MTSNHETVRRPSNHEWEMQTRALEHSTGTTHAVLKRRRIRKTSMKKLDRSISSVAPHVMSYENRCASRACARWMLSSPKKR